MRNLYYDAWDSRARFSLAWSGWWPAVRRLAAQAFISRLAAIRHRADLVAYADDDLRRSLIETLLKEIRPGQVYVIKLEHSVTRPRFSDPLAWPEDHERRTATLYIADGPEVEFPPVGDRIPWDGDRPRDLTTTGEDETHEEYP